MIVFVFVSVFESYQSIQCREIWVDVVPEGRAYLPLCWDSWQKGLWTENAPQILINSIQSRRRCGWWRMGVENAHVWALWVVVELVSWAGRALHPILTVEAIRAHHQRLVSTAWCSWVHARNWWLISSKSWRTSRVKLRMVRADSRRSRVASHWRRFCWHLGVT